MESKFQEKFLEAPKSAQDPTIAADEELQKIRNIEQYKNSKMIEREKLIKAAFSKGYFDDYKQVIKLGSKLWEAQNTLSPYPMSPLVPKLKAVNLLNQDIDLEKLLSRKISLVTFVQSASGVPHVKSFIDPFKESFANNPDVQLIQVNVEENWIKAPFLRMSVPLIRKNTPKEDYPRYLMCYQNIEEERRKSGMVNRVLGWSNLVDPLCRIRWQAHGPALQHEVESMKSLITVLIQQMKEPGQIKIRFNSKF